MRVPFAAMSCVASLSLVRAPSRATTSMHRAPRAVCSAPDALVDRGHRLHLLGGGRGRRR